MLIDGDTAQWVELTHDDARRALARLRAACATSVRDQVRHRRQVDAAARTLSVPRTTLRHQRRFATP